LESVLYVSRRPDRIRKPRVTPLDAFSVRVEWLTAVHRGGRLGGVQQLEADGYQLRYWTVNLRDEPVGDVVELSETFPAEAQHATVKWLKSGMTYVFQVAAFNSVDRGGWSDPSDPLLMPRGPACGNYSPVWEQDMTGTLLEAQQLCTPRNTGRSTPTGTQFSTEDDVLRCTSRTARSIEVCWQHIWNRGEPIVSYDVSCSEDPHFDVLRTRDIPLAGRETGLVLAHLSPHTTYYFRHRARTEFSVSLWSVSQAIRTLGLPPDRPAPPVRLHSQDSCGPSEMAICWKAPESNGVPIHHYRVSVRLGSSKDSVSETTVGPRLDSLSGPGGPLELLALDAGKSSPSRKQSSFGSCRVPLQVPTQFKLTGLRPNTEYSFAVKAVSQVKHHCEEQRRKP